MEDTKMKKHVLVVGAVHIGLGILGLIVALALLFFLSVLKGFVENEDIGRMVLGFLSINIPLLIGVIATLRLIGGIGLFSYRPWSRMLVIVVAALGCLNIPIGTLLGVYSIWVLLQDETIKLFKPEKAV